MKRLSVVVLSSIVATTIVFLVCDVYQWIKTPLTSYGMTHWIPELFGMFVLGRWTVSRVKRTIAYVIAGCAFVYPIITCVLINQISFGVGSASLFVAVLLMGIWSGAKKEDGE